MAILVTGGAGYIGSHTVLELLKRKEEVVVLDNLENGHREAIIGGVLEEGSTNDVKFLEGVFGRHNIEAIIHFAAYISVEESMRDPLRYYNNNVAGTINLLDVAVKHNVKKIIFSSTAAVYGVVEDRPLLETDKKDPASVYGRTKLMVEEILESMRLAYGVSYIVLRYFNACGADESGMIGEAHNKETHLIPLVLQVALGERESIDIYGTDYNTKDGTCIRDYIHVSDLASAHILALDKLRKDGGCEVYNLGNGVGFSVMDVVDKARIVTGVDIKENIRKRRYGDIGYLVAASTKAREELGFNPRYKDLEDIIRTAWKWHQNRRY